MKIAHLADLHIGYSHLNKKAKGGRNQRLVDFEEASLALAKAAVKNNPDVAVVSGDLFHKINMYPSALSGALKFIDVFTDAGIELVVIGGNHDESENEEHYNGLRFLGDHTPIKLFLHQDHYDIKNVRFHLVSYRLISRANDDRGILKPFEFDLNKANILVSHGYVSANPENDITVEHETLIPVEWLKDPRFDLKLLGHVHKHHEVMPGAFYPGSVERRNFGEVSERPGFYIHEIFPKGDASGKEGAIQTETNNYSIETSSIYLDEVSSNLPRPMLDYHFDLYQKDTEDFHNQITEIIQAAPQGAMMRIVIDRAPASLDKGQYRSVWEQLARKKSLLSFEASIRSQQMSQLMDVEFSTPPKDVGKGLLEYIGRQELLPEQRKPVIKLATEIITEATEKVLSSGEET